MNDFTCLPDCVVALPVLEWLDMGGNRLQHLPEDIDRWVREDSDIIRAPPPQTPANEQ